MKLPPELKEEFRSQIITETDYFILVLNHRPLSRGHLMIIPKNLSINAIDFSSDEAVDLFQLLTKAKLAQTEMYQPTGFNIFCNIGKSAGQTLKHTHIHILPRYDNEKSPFNKDKEELELLRNQEKLQLVQNIRSLMGKQ